MKQLDSKLIDHFIIILSSFVFFWFFLISFSSDNFFPFSRIWMFSYVPESSCSNYIEHEGKLFPVRTEMDILEIQQITSQYSEDTLQACSTIKKQFTYLPEQFKISEICNVLNIETKTVEKKTYEVHSCE